MKNKHFSKIFEVFNNPFFILVIIVLSMMPIQFITAQCSSTTDCSQSFTTLSANKVSLINPNGVTYNNMNIQINGTFTVDRNLTLNNCRIKMGPNATLLTTGAVLLAINCSSFFTCDNHLWEGIMVSSGCGLRLTQNHFQDARNAIQFQDGYRVPKFVIIPGGPTVQWINFIEGNTFDKNITGIRTANKVMLNPVRFVNNTFKMSDRAKLGPAETAGMILRNTTAILGDHGLNINVFEALEFGIKMESCNVQLTNFTFQRMRGYANNQTNNRATGIYAKNSALIVKWCKFLMNTYAGIITEGNRNLEVWNSDFQSEKTYLDWQIHGIYMYGGQLGSTFNIKDNVFDLRASETNYGIKTEKTLSPQNAMPTYSNIVNNKINIIEQTSFTITGGTDGINVSTEKDSYNDQLHISGNDIVIDRKPGGSTTGIRIYGSDINICRGLFVKRNEINFKYVGDDADQSNQWGIGLHKIFPGNITTDHPMANILEGNYVKVDQIKNNFTSANAYINHNSVVLCGIHIGDCPNMQVSENRIDKSHRGFHLWGNMQDCDFECNSLYKHTHGLHCDGKNNLDNQLNQANFWSDDAADYFYQAAYYSSGDLPGSPPYIFTANQLANIPGGRTLWPPSILPLMGWFVNDQNGKTECDDAPDGGGGLGGFDTRVVQETPLLPENAEIWNERRQLARRLALVPDLLGDSPMAAAWYANSVGSTYRQFADTHLAMAEAWACPTALTQAAQTALADQIGAGNAIVAMLDTLQQNPSDAALLVQFHTLVQTLEDAAQMADSLFSLIAVQQTLNFQALGTQLDILPDATPYTRNMKYVTQHYAHLALGLPVSAGQVDTLLSIAAQCAPLGGTAVILAAQYLPKHLADPYINDAQTPCVVSRPAKTDQELAPMNMQVIPNPARDLVQVMLDADGPITWSLWSPLGQSTATGQSVVPRFEVSLHNALPGTYWLSITTADGRRSVQKIVVLH